MRKLKIKGIGKEIAVARKAAGLSQVTLAARIGMDQPHVSRLERGAVRPTIQTLCRIATALGVDFSYDGRAVRFGPAPGGPRDSAAE